MLFQHMYLGDSEGIEFGYDVGVRHKPIEAVDDDNDNDNEFIGHGVSYQKRRGFDKTASLLGYIGPL